MSIVDSQKTSTIFIYTLMSMLTKNKIVIMIGCMARV